jgi:hypothetical protein
MRSSRVVRASGSQCRSRTRRVDPNIHRNSEIWEAADEAVPNKKRKSKNSLFKFIKADLQ